MAEIAVAVGEEEVAVAVEEEEVAVAVEEEEVAVAVEEEEVAVAVAVAVKEVAVAVAVAVGDNEQAGVAGIAELRKIVDASVHLKLLQRTGYIKKLVFTESQHYRAVSAELQINSWALNALLKCDSFDDSLLSKFLQTQGRLIKSCLEHAERVGSVNADAHPILRGLYEWTNSPGSIVYDSALHGHRPCLLYKAMEKLFNSLLEEFRNSGVRIVFADCSKIIIGTEEYDMSAAKVRCNDLLQTIKSRDQFEWIEFEPLQFWQSLLFVDQYNYCGKLESSAKTSTTSLPETVKNNDCGKSESSKETSTNNHGKSESSKETSTNNHGKSEESTETNTKSLWNIVEYLPKTVKSHFEDIVSRYVCWNSKLVSTMYAGAPIDFELVMMESINEKIISYLLDLVIERVKDINSRKIIDKYDEIFYPFRQLMCDHRHSIPDGVELIKNVCGVLSFDKSVEIKVEVLRINLFRYFNARPWSPENLFHYEACHSFILPNVTCRHCYVSRDLDLCCDLSLLTTEWRCPVLKCGKPYDCEEMESILIQITKEREWLYLQQDIVCSNCNLVSKSLFATYCRVCGRELTGKDDLREFKREMQVILMIASSKKFQVLEEICKRNLS